jgi:hypothetical protein
MNKYLQLRLWAALSELDDLELPLEQGQRGLLTLQAMKDEEAEGIVV